MTRLPNCVNPESVALALESLRAPPCEKWIVRPDRIGDPLLRIWLPLELCRRRNQQERRPRWAWARDKQALWAAMRVQVGPREKPIEGRPRVLVCRFSARLPDSMADGAKAAIDMLCVPNGRVKKYRLGWLKDDSPRHIEQVDWWEKAPARLGVVMIEVRNGRI